jgi:hypothetical protein
LGGVCQDHLLTANRESGSLTPGSVPSTRQLGRILHDTRRVLETFGENALVNLLQEFCNGPDSFCRKLLLHPPTFMLFATRQGLEWLSVYGNKYIYCDGTFNLTNTGLELTTIMIQIHDIAVPVAWCFMRTHTTEDYARLFNELRELTLHRWKPEWLISDFETAMRNGIAQSTEPLHVHATELQPPVTTAFRLCWFVLTVRSVCLVRFGQSFQTVCFAAMFSTSCGL